MAHKSTEGYLWQDGSGGSSGLHTEAVTPSTPHIQDHYDAVVIGAGFAGLVAARELSANGRLKVLLVDGRDRIGGRTWTAKALGQHFEMGGTWVHWIQPFVFAEISRYGLQRHLKTSSGPLATERLYAPSSGGMLTMTAKDMDPTMLRIAQAFFSIDGLSSRELMPYPFDLLRKPAPWTKYDHLTVRDRLDQIEGETPQAKEIFEAMICTFGGVSGAELAWTEALRWYVLGGHDLDRTFEFAGLYKLGGGGMTMLAKSILGDYGGDILMQTTIRTIAQNDDRVVLTATDGREIRASHVVCTIPLCVVDTWSPPPKLGLVHRTNHKVSSNALPSIQFDPPFESVRQEAVRTGHVCNVPKFHIQLASEEPPFSSSADATSASPYCFACSDHAGPAGTFAIAFGYSGKLTDPKNHGEILSQFEKHMKPGTKARAYLTHDWVADPLANGSWACWGAGSMSRYLAALQQPHGRVAMASADWANGFRGFIDRAIEQGILSARHVERKLRVSESNL